MNSTFRGVYESTKTHVLLRILREAIKKSVERVALFTKHTSSKTWWHQVKRRTLQWWVINQIIWETWDKLATEDTKRHDGTESTLNNKARWQSLRNQGEGVPGEEAGRKGDKQGEGCKEGEIKKYRHPTCLWVVNNHQEGGTDSIGAVVFIQILLFFCTYIHLSTRSYYLKFWKTWSLSYTWFKVRPCVIEGKQEMCLTSDCHVYMYTESIVLVATRIIIPVSTYLYICINITLFWKCSISLACCFTSKLINIRAKYLQYKDGTIKHLFCCMLETDISVIGCVTGPKCLGDFPWVFQMIMDVLSLWPRKYNVFWYKLDRLSCLISVQFKKYQVCEKNLFEPCRFNLLYTHFCF